MTKFDKYIEVAVEAKRMEGSKYPHVEIIEDMFDTGHYCLTCPLAHICIEHLEDSRDARLERAEKYLMESVDNMVDTINEINERSDT